MTDDKQITQAWYLALAMLVVFAASRFLGGSLFDNDWSFIHLAHMPLWLVVVWAGLLVVLPFLLIRYGAGVTAFFSTGLRVAVAAIILFVLTVVFQHDSFILGGGNLRVAQIAQVPRIVYRWFEFGTDMLVSWFYAGFSLFDMTANMAAVTSWRVTAFIATATALVGCLKLAAELTNDTTRRFFLFLVMFIGPQTALYFGFVGVEPVIPAFTIWVAWAALRLNRSGRSRELAFVWGLTLLGLFMHVWLVFLLPAVVFVTTRQFTSRGKRLSTPVLLSGLIACAALFVLIYWRAGVDFEFSRGILFLGAKPPFGDYSLFSPRHIGDVVQMFLLVAPVVMVTKYLWMRRLSSLRSDADLVTLSLMTLAGGGVMVITDPVNSVVFDLPRLAAFLTPTALLLGFLLADLPVEQRISHRLLAVTAALVLIAPLSYLPVVTKIRRMETYAVSYFDRHNLHYLDAGLAFRDAYFYLRHYDDRKEVIRVPGYEHVTRGQLGSKVPSAVGTDSTASYLDTLGLDTTNLELSNKWEWSMPTISVDFLNLRGATDLITAGQLNEAATILYRMKAQRPYWAEARATLAGVLIQLGRPSQARSEIDTCLMLQPYKRAHHVNNYICYRDLNKYYEALKAVECANELFPGDNEILTDMMIIYYRAGNGYEADTMAASLIAADSTLPYPYLIKGFLADSREEIGSAMRYYERFITLAPEQPETERVKKRLENLTAQFHED